MICFWGPLRALIFWYLLFFLAAVSNGLQCKPKSFLSLGLNCPEDFSDKSFCCERENGAMFCCDFDDYVKMNSGKYVLPVAIGIAFVIVIGCALCCLCCPCCMLYKRRHRGTVYGRVQQPTAVVTVQPPGPAPPMLHAQGNMQMPNTMPMPMPISMPMSQAGVVHVAPYPPYHVPAGDSSGQHSMPPPPYSAVVASDGYAKQAPYNPNFYNN